VATRKLQNVDAFVVTDLPDAERSIGVVRLAPKVLVDGASLLARSLTYQFAAFSLPVGGASAGINAPADGRDAAIGSFVEEIGPDVAEGRLLLDAAKGISDDDLAPLRALDTRPALAFAVRDELAGTTAAAAADAAAGGLDGLRIALESLDATSIAFAAAAAARGASIVAIGGAGGSVAAPDGFDPGALQAAVHEHGPDAFASLGNPVKAWITAADVDVLAVGSKAGVVSHEVAAGITARVVVPTAPVPVTARALAVLTRAGITYVPDFLALAGPAFALTDTSGADVASLSETATRAVTDAMADAVAHEHGLFLGACARAEAFLATWTTVPFGRPLA